MAEHDPLIGRQLGPYQVQHKLGEGGMARVYKAYHARLRRHVAIKVILAPDAGDGDFRARFEREAQLIASLEHPNIVAVYDFSDEGPFAYLVMQYVGGGTLRDQLRSPLAPDRAAHYALLMARALHHAHQRGIVHRDVKPQNMLVSAQDRNQLLLSDFGIARLFDSSQEVTWANGNYSGNRAGLTQADQIIGTAEYMAPEQIKRQPIDARADVYALGVVLFQILTGRVPFLSTTIAGLMYQHVHSPAPSVLEFNSNIPESLALITTRSLQKAPEHRFESAEAMAQALESVLSTMNSHYLAPDTYATARRDPAVSTYKQAPTLPSAPVYEPSYPTSSPATSYADYPTTGTHGSYPLRPAARKTISAQVIAGIAILIIVLAVIVMRFQASPGVTQTTTNTVHTTTTASFVDTFATNSQDWVEGSIGGLTASVNNGQYTLTTDTQNDTYFPYPASGGALPKNFTLSTRIRQDTGGQDRFYGLALNLRYQQNTARSCYAFVVSSNGNYMVLRYDTPSMGAISPTVLWQGRSSAIHGLHQINELQVTDLHGTFTFKINGLQVPLKQGRSITDTTYTGSQPGLMVTGPGAGFVVTRMQLAIW